jgi:hypothetical protein
MLAPLVRFISVQGIGLEHTDVALKDSIHLVKYASFLFEMSLAIINDIFCGFDHLFDRDQF